MPGRTGAAAKGAIAFLTMSVSDIAPAALLCCMTLAFQIPAGQGVTVVAPSGSGKIETHHRGSKIGYSLN
jgi:hypothetical protein